MFYVRIKIGYLKKMAKNERRTDSSDGEHGRDQFDRVLEQDQVVAGARRFQRWVCVDLVGGTHRCDHVSACCDAS